MRAKPSSLLNIVESREGPRTRVQLQGELDIATAPAVTERLDRLRDRHEHVVLDLDELAFIDVWGLRLVLAAVQDSRRDGWSLAVTRGSRSVRLLVEILGLDSHLPYDGRTP